MNLGPIALAWLLHRDGGVCGGDPPKPTLERPVYDLKPKDPPRPPRARAMISLFMQGGPSHLDLFDPKPELQKSDGKTFTGEIRRDNDGEASARLLASPWKFKQHGVCGIALSELLPGLG